ncbi:hypothetical protein JCM10914A_45140 [Paenibacillus sp. JCM 10914]|uniref:hypothetical protein n=1 Tax=Paenibacillus sp. JCM 10914 TaxID=1236974 RepID=UPI0003CC7866|nr:hypothetical protein [Paenibacillus sp. JCM 10914]GAE09169.1 hypothetical protein JCM10914_5518 [Paenibacillus sp. JCM 10914]
MTKKSFLYMITIVIILAVVFLLMYRPFFAKQGDRAANNILQPELTALKEKYKNDVSADAKKTANRDNAAQPDASI